LHKYVIEALDPARHHLVDPPSVPKHAERAVPKAPNRSRALMAAVVVACGYNERMALAGAGCFLVAKAPRHGEVDPGRRSCPRVPGGVIVVAMQR
jgi:hypothetical protein